MKIEIVSCKIYRVPCENNLQIACPVPQDNKHNFLLIAPSMDPSRYPNTLSAKGL
jgi:hypothetical protein